jgi:hypothetical protein
MDTLKQHFRLVPTTKQCEDQGGGRENPTALQCLTALYRRRRLTYRPYQPIHAYRAYKYLTPTGGYPRLVQSEQPPPALCLIDLPTYAPPAGYRVLRQVEDLSGSNHMPPIVLLCYLLHFNTKSLSPRGSPYFVPSALSLSLLNWP